jgi:AcrR family transcriptional regulator
MNTVRDAGDGRAAQRSMALEAAARIVAADGLRALTARRLAEAVGCSVGTLYNLFGNTDAVVRALNLETLRALDAALAAAWARPAATAQQAVLGIARAYLDFTAAHRPRWAAVLEFAPAASHPETDDAIDALVARVDAALAPLCADPVRRRLAAAVLWTGLEGIGALATAGNARRLSEAEPWPMACCLVETFLAGLSQPR